VHLQARFFQFCDVAKVVIIHSKKIAKFGYKLDMKIEKKIESL
jgi:hypothetical protein